MNDQPDSLSLPSPQRQLLLFSILLFTAYALIAHKWGHIGDMDCWMRWSKYMHENGLVKVYESGCDYMPGFLYILWFNTKIQHTATNVQDNLYIFKFMVLLFDFAGAYLTLYYVRDGNRRLFAYLLLLLNPAFIYNTLVWGQVDAIFSAIGFAAMLAAIERRLFWSCFLLVVALNFKLQALVFIPVTGLILLPQFVSAFSVRTVLSVLSAFALAQLLMVFPFLVKGHVADVWKVVAGSVGHYPYISMAAMNAWFFFVPGDVEHHAHYRDTAMFLGLSLKHWGFLLFFSMLFAAVWPMLRVMWKALVQRQPASFPLEKVFLMSALTATAFFYGNTQMHERYFHPALLSLAAYTFLTGRFLPLVMGSVAYFLNLERILQSLALTNYGTLIFKPWFVSALYLVLIVYLYYRLYSDTVSGSREVSIAFRNT